jgi:hypothetical protein
MIYFFAVLCLNKIDLFRTIYRKTFSKFVYWAVWAIWHQWLFNFWAVLAGEVT